MNHESKCKLSDDYLWAVHSMAGLSGMWDSHGMVAWLQSTLCVCWYGHHSRTWKCEGELQTVASMVWSYAWLGLGYASFCFCWANSYTDRSRADRHSRVELCLLALGLATSYKRYLNMTIVWNFTGRKGPTPTRDLRCEIIKKCGPFFLLPLCYCRLDVGGGSRIRISSAARDIVISN